MLVSDTLCEYIFPVVARRLAIFLTMREAEIGDSWPMWAVSRDLGQRCWNGKVEWTLLYVGFAMSYLYMN